MPFTYLGLPLGTTKPSVQDFCPLLNRIERRLSGFNRLLSYDGRLILVNAALLYPHSICAASKSLHRWLDKLICIGNTAFGARGISKEKAPA